MFVDDHITLAQGDPVHLQHVRQTLLHQIDCVFCPLNPGNHPSRQEPISTKKLAKGDGQWSTQKTVLGWALDTAAATLELPPHQAARLHELLASVPRSSTRISVQWWHQLLGKLRSMVLALPGSRGLFSTLQEAFHHWETQHQLQLCTATHDFLDDFHWLAHDLTRCPTRMRELVPQLPQYVGSCDASGLGMGGVWFLPSPASLALLWHTPFPAHIQRELVSAQNPSRSISNSDLELAGAITHQDVLASQANVAKTTNALVNDNMAAIHWLQRGSITTTKAAAYLLRLHALHQ